MKREDLEKLLGGYAAGTLTDEERRALLEAAVSDQALFDALALEEPLRDALADPASRARLLAVLETPRPRAWFGTPRIWALGASVAGAAVIAVLAFRFAGAPTPAVPQLELAQLRPTPPVAPPVAVEPVREAKVKASKVPHKAPVTRAVESAAPEVRSQPPEAETRVMETSARSLYLAHHVVTADRARLGAAVFTAKSGETAAAQVGLGLRYAVLRRGVDGNYFDVPLDTVFAAGETVRVRIEANEAGYLYVLGSSGVLFDGAVVAWRPVSVDVPPGTLRVVLSRQPDSGSIETIESRTRLQLSNVSLAVDAPTELRPRDQTVYVVNPSGAPDARVLAEIRIVSR
jgi:hypothetical protein